MERSNELFIESLIEDLDGTLNTIHAALNESSIYSFEGREKKTLYEFTNIITVVITVYETRHENLFPLIELSNKTKNIVDRMTGEGLVKYHTKDERVCLLPPEFPIKETSQN